MSRVCHVCASDRMEVLFEPKESPGPVVKCSDCGFVYVNPIQSEKALIREGPVLDEYPEHLLTSDDLDLIPGTWEEPIIEGFMQEAPAKTKNAQEALNYLDKYAPQRGRLLDFGSGVGLFLSVAAEDGWECYGLEPLVMSSVFARGHFGLNIVTDTLRPDTFEADFFDAITSFQVFEHIVDPIPEVEKLRSFLKPGGHILIEVPNIDTLGVRIMGAKHRHFVQDHVSFFSADTLGRFLNKMGFDVCEVYYPVRTLSLHHLAGWSGRLTSQRVGDSVQKVVDRVGLGDATVRLSFGDIVAVIAQKSTR